jgi:hypothetical protein
LELHLALVLLLLQLLTPALSNATSLSSVTTVGSSVTCESSRHHATYHQ